MTFPWKVVTCDRRSRCLNIKYQSSVGVIWKGNLNLRKPSLSSLIFNNLLCWNYRGEWNFSLAHVPVCHLHLAQASGDTNNNCQHYCPSHKCLIKSLSEFIITKILIFFSYQLCSAEFFQTFHIIKEFPRKSVIEFIFRPNTLTLIQKEDWWWNKRLINTINHFYLIKPPSIAQPVQKFQSRKIVGVQKSEEKYDSIRSLNLNHSQPFKIFFSYPDSSIVSGFKWILTLKQEREDFWGLSIDNVAIQGIIFTQSTIFPTQQSRHCTRAEA